MCLGRAHRGRKRRREAVASVPERPDLEYVVPILARELAGASIVGAIAKKPVVLRCSVEEPRGPIRDVKRRYHSVVFAMGERDLVVLPMLAGRFDLAAAEAKDPGDLAVKFSLADGRALRYRDDVQMGKVWWTAPGTPIPGLAEGGIDVLGPEFTRARFRALAKGRRDQVKVFLMDRTALDAMGNAYADEVLWAAKLHPKRAVARLKPEEFDALHDAIVEVLAHARDVIAKRQPPLPEKVRDFLNVRGREGDPCPRCGGRIRTAGIHGHDACFCPTCQPDSDGRGFVDWRKT